MFFRLNRHTFSPKELGGGFAGSEVIECQTVTDKHPLQFQIDCNEKYHKNESPGGYTTKEEYTVVNWKEITKDEYEKYKGWIG